MSDSVTFSQSTFLMPPSESDVKNDDNPGHYGHQIFEITPDSPPSPSPSPSSSPSHLSPISEQPLSPPHPPPMPNTDMSFRFQIYKLTEKLEALEEIIKGDCTIGISGVKYLRQSENYPPTWEDRLHTFLFDAGVHFAWYLNFVSGEDIPDDCEEQDPNIVYIYFINDVTRTQSAQNIVRFLRDHYDNFVYLL